MIDDFELEHYGTPRHSGRYPWGSGENPYQRTGDFVSIVRDMKAAGVDEDDIAKSMGMTVRQLRSRYSSSLSAQKAAMISEAYRLKEKGYSNQKIGDMLGGISEGKVRNLLKPAAMEKALAIENTKVALKEGFKNNRFLDVGKNMGPYLGVSDTKLAAAVQQLQDEEGYVLHKLKIDQLGTPYKTDLMVLCPPKTEFMDLVNNRDQIGYLTGVKLEDGGSTMKRVYGPPENIDSKRIAVRFGDEGGSGMDGVILVRPGVDDVSLGKSRYAQVRIMVDGTHYMKGMAMYSDDLPEGVDLLFNTNKTRAKCEGDKMKALKSADSDDPENPFKAATKQRTQDVIDRHGVMNIVYEEGDWAEWSKTLSSQVLSKQPVSLAKRQLNIDYENRLAEYNEIMSIDNPVIRKKMLMDYASSCDAAAVHLKAAAMPRQASHVILPFPDMKEDEIYAPNYENGETVVLIRHPHAGPFEIPTLKVNNKHKLAKQTLGDAPDAVGINSKVAERLSGADFDGDTALVIPNNEGLIKTKPALEKLKDFDPKAAYPKYDGMTRVGDKKPDEHGNPGDGFNKGIEMGKISNLITDMTIGGAEPNELAAAVRHSMVVIDAEKHQLNWKQSYIDNGIASLRKKYQGAANAGASTLISRAKSPVYVDQRSLRTKIDKETGELTYIPTHATYKTKDGKIVERKTKVPLMSIKKDAYELSSGSRMEDVYANYANQMKALGNQARKEAVTTTTRKYSSESRKTYAKEVSSLEAKLKEAQANSPKERQAQLIGNIKVRARIEANPDMDKDEVSKVKAKELSRARAAVGAKRVQIEISDREWEAIQAGAITNNMLNEIVHRTDTDQLRQLAIPKTSLGLSKSQISRAKALAKSGYTQNEIAKQLGVSSTTISKAISS